MTIKVIARINMTMARGWSEASAGFTGSSATTSSIGVQSSFDALLVCAQFVRRNLLRLRESRRRWRRGRSAVLVHFLVFLWLLIRSTHPTYVKVPVSDTAVSENEKEYQ